MADVAGGLQETCGSCGSFMTHTRKDEGELVRDTWKCECGAALVWRRKIHRGRPAIPPPSDRNAAITDAAGHADACKAALRRAARACETAEALVRVEEVESEVNSMRLRIADLL